MSYLSLSLYKSELGVYANPYFNSAYVQPSVVMPNGTTALKKLSEVLLEWNDALGMWKEVLIFTPGVTVVGVKMINPLTNQFAYVRGTSINDLHSLMTCYSDTALIAPLTDLEIMLSGSDLDATNNFSLKYGTKQNNFLFTERVKQDTITLSVPKIAGAIDEEITRYYFWDLNNNYFNYMSPFRKIGETSTHWIIQGDFEIFNPPANNSADILAITQIKTLELRRNGHKLSYDDFAYPTNNNIVYADNGAGGFTTPYGAQPNDPSLFPPWLYGIPANYMDPGHANRFIVYFGRLKVLPGVTDFTIESNIPGFGIQRGLTTDGFGIDAHVYFYDIDGEAWPEDGSWFIDTVDVF
jgi:hypothetical protein